MSDAGVYHGSEYSPPGIVRLMGSILRIPRRWHETDFSYVFSTDKDLQHEYVDGLLVAANIFFMIFCAWAFILVVLKVKGKEVGCASGRAFHTEKIDEDMQSTDSSESYFSSSVDNDSSKGGIIELERERSTDKILDSHSSFEDERDGSEGSHGSQEYGSQDGWLSVGEIQSRVNPRERRTRFCFLVFALVSLLCVPLVLIFSFGPIKEAARASDDLLLIVHDSIGQVSASLDTIDGVAASASTLVEDLPVDAVHICPLVKKENFESELGINLNDLLDTVSLRFEDVDAYVTEILVVVETVVTRVSDGAIAFEESVDTTEQILWIVPAVLFAVSMLVAIAALGVLLAWKNKSGARIQAVLSYGVLPLLILVSTACWIITIAAAFGTMTSSDFCTSGSRTGSPDATIQEILATFDNGQNDTVHQFINAYTNRCIGPDPVVEIDEIEIMVQDTIDTIWRQLSIVDKIGRAELVEQCGGGTHLADLFTGVRNLAKLLTTIRKSLGSASTSLECQRINPIYSRVAHDSICTDAASAAAYGFLLFLILGISTMVLVSLRASWLKNVEEEKVYHDENEIAENMILDEHEEYLAYISRYKHEWQEYHGFEASSVVHSSALSYRGDQSQGSSEGSMYFEDLSQEQSGEESVEEYDLRSGATAKEGGGPAGIDVQISSSSFHTASIHDGARACAIDEISFQSLSAHKSEESVDVSIREEELFTGPSPLLPPAENPDFREDAPDVILVPSTEIILKDSRMKKMTSHNSSRSKSSNSLRSSGSAQSVANQVKSIECTGSFHERPDTPAAAAGARSRTATWAEGEGTSRRRATAVPANGTLTRGESGQPVRRTATWGGESAPVIQRTQTLAELKPDDVLRRTNRNPNGKKATRPSTTSTRESQSCIRSEESEKVSQSQNMDAQSQTKELEGGLVEL
eukprot:CAMPEP_0116998862 /NCGR_PEP_ID=MMETSP0472-20121206/1785_1 /TAXON_ID=693140 ORGANISM="Tiarina fusus, Strain LIS" /NCGR_SAMPLE_ID=MMETSP0472 /ASSEMBLY_ACC=CAM_ASM_000603 /LENGTH=923 /DNA_ID=CAMNT_0004698141 /DNA_START=148 /DNA_END=2919 /DNA_ORIENTATION=+